MKKKVLCLWVAVTMTAALTSGCGRENAVAFGAGTVENVMEGTAASGAVVPAVQADLTNAAQINLSQGSQTISKAGTYVLAGTLAAGQVVVDCDKESEVVLVLNGADITCEDGAAILRLPRRMTRFTVMELYALTAAVSRFAPETTVFMRMAVLR